MTKEITRRQLLKICWLVPAAAVVTACHPNPTPESTQLLPNSDQNPQTVINISQIFEGLRNTCYDCLCIGSVTFAIALGRFIFDCHQFSNRSEPSTQQEP
jgi:hypothetical protein